MAPSVPKNCEICEESFKEGEHCPRVLPCSHCMCQQCLNQILIRKNNFCPFCRQGFHASSAYDIPKNRYLLDLLQYVEEMERKMMVPSGNEGGSENAATTDSEISPSRDFLSVVGLKRMMDTTRMMYQKEGIYAVQHKEGKNRYGRISFSPEGDKFFLHHLKEETSISPLAKLIKFDEVMNLAGIPSQQAFLTLGYQKGKPLGRILIRLVENSNYSLNFTLLCTGERGPSYATSNVWRLVFKGMNGEEAYMGDYEKKKGNGGQPLVSGVDWNNEYCRNIHQRPSFVAGLVRGCGMVSQNSLFGIFLKDNPGEHVEGIFGVVEEGLPDLKKILGECQDVREIKVIDCGIVLL